MRGKLWKDSRGSRGRHTASTWGDRGTERVAWGSPQLLSPPVCSSVPGWLDVRDGNGHSRPSLPRPEGRNRQDSGSLAF